MFGLGAIFGKLMGDSGAAKAIAVRLAKLLGKDRAAGFSADAFHRVAVIASSGLDSLPHSGPCVTTCVVTIIALVITVILAMFGVC